MDLSWMRDIENVEKYLDKDMKLVYENCGIETVISLLSGLPSITIYVSKASLNRAQEVYILEQFTGTGKKVQEANVKEVAIKIGCSERMVYKVIKKHLESKTKKPEAQAQLFED